LYNLAEDPQETVNVRRCDPKRASQLRERLAGWLESRPPPSDAEALTDEQSRRRLKAIGYLQ